MYVEQSNEEWRQWIKLTKKKESTSSTSLRDSAIDLLMSRIFELEEENTLLHTKLMLYQIDRERMERENANISVQG